MQLTIEDIHVEVTRKSIKNMYLRVYPPDGRVVVSAPRSMGDAAVKAFVTSRLAWIHEQRAKIAARAQETQADDTERDSIYLWGERFPLEIVEGVGYLLFINQGKALFYVPPDSTAELREQYLVEWYRMHLRAEVSRLMPLCEARTGLTCAEWRLKNMKTRWGTCNTKARRIWLNVQLAKYPTRCLEYVIAHELTHLIEPSHGPAFKAKMDEFMPEWRDIRKELNSLAAKCP